MKSNRNLLIYLFGLAAGILLLVFANETTLFSSIVSILGILFLIPCVIAFIVTILPPKNPDGTKTINWFTVFAAGLGIAFGICLVCVPSFFAAAIIYTLGGILIIAGLGGIAALISTHDFTGNRIWFFIVPILVLIAGVVMIILGRPRMVDHLTAIIAGVGLILFSVNGFWAFLKDKAIRKVAAKQK